MIRRDLLRKEVLDKHLRAWERAPGYIGGAEEVRAVLIVQEYILMNSDSEMDNLNVVPPHRNPMHQHSIRPPTQNPRSKRRSRVRKRTT